MINKEPIHTIQFSLKSFLLDGSINNVRIGASMDATLNSIGHPVTYANKDIDYPNLFNSVVWNYGRFYLEFEIGKVSKIAWSSYSTVPARPKVECTDFSNFFNATLNECIEFLEKNDVLYDKKQNTTFSKRRKMEIPAPGFSLIISNQYYIRIKYGSENELVGMSCSNLQYIQ